MAATLTAYNAALKRIYTPERIEEQLYNETPFLNRVEKTDKYSIGELGRSVIHLSRNGGFTALPDGGGTLNTAGNQGFNKAEYTYNHFHQPIDIQGDVLDQTSSNSLSLASALDTEVSGALTDLRRAIQRQLYLNGDALIARCKTSDSNDVDLNYSGEEAIARGWIYVNQLVDVGTTADEVAISNGVTVSAIASDSFTSSAGNVTTEGTTHYVSHKDSRAATTSYEMNGLRNIVSTTATLGGLDPATVTVWQAAGNTTASQPLTLSLMLQQDQAIHQKTGKKANFVLTGLKQARKFYELLQQQVRFSSDTSLAAGAQESNPKWNGMEIFTDPDCWDGDMYFGQLEHLFILQARKLYWQNVHTGGEAITWAQGTDKYVGKLTYRLELGTRRRNAFSRLGYTVDLSATASGLS